MYPWFEVYVRMFDNYIQVLQAYVKLAQSSLVATPAYWVKWPTGHPDRREAHSVAFDRAAIVKRG